MLNEETYKKLAQQSVPKETMTFRLDDPLLFDAIATQKLPPGPGPQLTENNLAKPKSGAADVR